MTFYVLCLVLTAAVIHAFWNYLAKRTNGKLPFIWLIYIGSSVLYLPVAFYESLATKVDYSRALLLFSLSSAVIHLVYFIVLQTGYRKADLSVVYPLARGSGPLFSTIIAVLLLKEKSSVLTVSGLMLIVAGVMVITRFHIDLKQNHRLRVGLWYGIATGFFIAAYTVNDNIAVKQYQVSPLFITLASNIFGSVVLIPFALRQFADVKMEFSKHKWSIVAISILSPAAYILVLVALQQAPLVLVAPAREASILFGVFFGSKLLDEKEAKRRAFASLLIVAGIICLGAS